MCKTNKLSLAKSPNRQSAMPLPLPVHAIKRYQIAVVTRNNSNNNNSIKYKLQRQNIHEAGKGLPQWSASMLCCAVDCLQQQLQLLQTKFYDFSTAARCFDISLRLVET